MSWNYMQAEIVPADRLIRPTIGPGDLSRDRAHQEIQNILDGGGAALASVSAAWKRGAQDDTVFTGPFVWTIYEHDDGADPCLTALEWLEDFAATMRSTGLDVQVARKERD